MSKCTKINKWAVRQPKVLVSDWLISITLFHSQRSGSWSSTLTEPPNLETTQFAPSRNLGFPYWQDGHRWKWGEVGLVSFLSASSPPTAPCPHDSSGKLILLTLTNASSEACIRGHRSAKCQHFDRSMKKIRKSGRPLSKCPHATKPCDCVEQWSLPSGMSEGTYIFPKPPGFKPSIIETPDAHQPAWNRQ